MQNESREAISSALDKGLYGYAVELAKSHLESYPKDGIAWIEIAKAYTQLSRYDEAEAAFDKAYKHAHTMLREMIYVKRAGMYQRQGRPFDAEKCYKKAIAENPTYAGNYVFLGILAFRRGDLALAESIHRQGAACVGECADECYANLGGVLVAQQRYEEAEECFQKAIELDPNYKWAKFRLRDVKEIRKLKRSK